MKPLPHRYDVHVGGGPTGYAALTATDRPNIASAPPLEFDGPGDAWSPEHLLLAAVSTCFLFTLRAVAQASGVHFIALDLATEGTVDRENGQARFTHIVLRPRLVVPAGTERERALRVIDKAHRGCLVSASLATPIRLEPEIAKEG